jgi:hypothetical protein
MSQIPPSATAAPENVGARPSAPQRPSQKLYIAVQRLAGGRSTAGSRIADAALAEQRLRYKRRLGQKSLPADREEQRDPERTERAGHGSQPWHADHLRHIGWRPGFPELPENQYYPLLQGAKDENKGIVGTWEVDVIDALRPMSNEPIVINFGSDSFEGTNLDRILRAANVGHLFVSGQCIEHVVATTIKRAAKHGLQRHPHQRRDQRVHR